MAEATIQYDIPMGHWPPESTLVHLNPPLRRFNPLDGTPIDYPYVAVQRQTVASGASEDATYLYPSDADGGFVQDFMAPLEKRDPGLVHTVLKSMGYAVTN